MSTSGHASEHMLSSILMMLWWCEGKGVAGEHRVGEGGGGGGGGGERRGRRVRGEGGAEGDTVGRGAEGVRVFVELYGT